MNLELSGGARLERDRLATPPKTQSILWGGLDLDVNVSRAWYLMLSGITERGGGDATSQIYGGLRGRFLRAPAQKQRYFSRTVPRRGPVGNRPGVGFFGRRGGPRLP